MHLESIRVERFRSIEDAELPECGGFNVLIGKNNSGKSNLLSAIQTLFMSLREGEPVTLNPPVGKEIDFFQRDTTSPISIRARFEISPAERDALERDLINEAPQLKTVVDGLDPALRLLVTVNILHEPGPFAVVSKLALSDKSGESERTILEVPYAAAQEIHENAIRARARDADVEGIRAVQGYIDADDWERMRQAASGSRQSLRAFLPAVIRRRSVEFQQRTTALIDSVFNRSESFAEFSEGLDALLTTASHEAALGMEELRQPVGSFAGEEHHIPEYAKKSAVFSE